MEFEVVDYSKEIVYCVTVKADPPKQYRKIGSIWEEKTHMGWHQIPFKFIYDKLDEAVEKYKKEKGFDL